MAYDPLNINESKPQSSGYDPLGINESDKSALVKSAIISHNVDSDKYAENRKKAVAQGLPTSLATSADNPVNSDDMMTTIKNFMGLKGKTATFMSNPDNAAVAKDDHENLTVTEKISGLFKDLNNILYGDVENVESLFTGIVGSTVGAVAGLTTLGLSKAMTGEADVETAKKVHQRLADFLTYKPKSEKGKEIEEDINRPVSILGAIPQPILSLPGNVGRELVKPILQSTNAPEEVSYPVETVAEFGGYVLFGELTKATNSHINSLVDSVKESKLLKRDPELHKSFVEDVSKDTPPIQSTPEAVESVLKKADKTPENLSDPQAFYEAKFMGEKVDLPIQDVVANAKHISPDNINDMSVKDIPSINELEQQKGGEALSTRGVDVLGAAVERGIIPETGELPTHNKFNIEAEDVKANDYIKQNPETALSQVLDEKNINNPYIESIYKNLETKAIQEGDVDSLLKLSKSDVPSEAGLRLKLLDSNNPDNPVKIMRDIRKSREESYIKKEGKPLDYAKHEEEVSRLKADLEAKDKALNAALAKVKERISTSAKLKYGTRNKIVTQDEYLKVKADLRQKFSS